VKKSVKNEKIESGDNPWCEIGMTTYTAEPSWNDSKPGWMIYAHGPQPKRPYKIVKRPLFIAADEAERDHVLNLLRGKTNDDQHGQHAALPTAHPAARIQGHPDMQGVYDIRKPPDTACITGIGAAYNAN
jgi:hypothetical protein